MKKLLFNLFLLVSTLSLVSCSGNDDDVNLENKNELKVVIDGKEEVFNTIVVNKNAQNPFGNNEVVQLTATINSSTAKVITFLLEKGAVGNNTLGVFTYTDNGETYTYGGVSVVTSSCNATSNLTFVASKNDDTTLSGNFSGKLEKCDSNDKLKSKIITSGSFTFNY